MSGANNTMRRIGNSVMTRLLVIGCLVMTLLIPIEMITKTGTDLFSALFAAYA